MLEFQLLKTDDSGQTSARRGRLRLNHGVVETPIFMPVGTYGSVKAMSPLELKEIDAQIILGNTFHLWLRPGTEVLDKFGGLHRFMGWDKPILTDSGGFQVFSLGAMRKITRRGRQVRLADQWRQAVPVARSVDADPARAEFRHRDAVRRMHAVPRSTAARPPRTKRRKSMRMSLRWAKRSHRRICQAAKIRTRLFGIVQGGMFEDLRDESLAGLEDIDFHGIAIGGLSVGEPKEDMMRVLEHIGPRLPADKPHYLMGVGTPEDLVAGVATGVDMFDCVMPTRNARNGWLFTRFGDVKIKNAR